MEIVQTLIYMTLSIRVRLGLLEICLVVWVGWGFMGVLVFSGGSRRRRRRWSR